MVNIDELMRLRAAATPGPWYATHDINGDIAPFVEGATGWVFGEGFDPIDGESYMRPSFNDLEYIVAACNAVPELVARIRELEEQLGKQSLKQFSAPEPCRIVSNNNGTPPEWLMRRFTEVK